MHAAGFLEAEEHESLRHMSAADDKAAAVVAQENEPKGGSWKDGPQEDRAAGQRWATGPHYPTEEVAK